MSRLMLHAQSSTRRSARDDLPGDITVTPRDVDESGSVGIYVRATAADARLQVMETIERRFVVPFVAERASLVEVWLESRCFRETCPAGTTCGRLECESVRNPATQGYSPTPTPGPADAGGRDVATLPPSDVVDGAVTDAVIAPDVVDVVDVLDVVDVVDAPDVIDVVDAGRFDVPADCGDLTTSTANCGACGRACRGDQVCTDGVCRCPALQADCGGSCVNLMRDVHNCGACGQVCGSGGFCVNGRCDGGCEAGLTPCGDAGCFDLMSNPSHCGSCDAQCLMASTCRAGMCTDPISMCTAPMTMCGRGCVNLQTDSANCGACGHLCASRDRCCRGACSDPDASACVE